MNSPPESGSPTAMSTPSSGTPTEDYQPTTSSGYLATLTSHLTNAFGGGASGAGAASGSGAGGAGGAGGSKRRLPTGSSFGPSSSSKSRRRGDTSRSNTGTWDASKEGGSGGPGAPGATQGSKKEKDDLLDHGVVEFLRKEIGDPFLEPGLKG